MTAPSAGRPTVLLDQSALRRPGRDRGLGRYATAIRTTAEATGRFRVVPVDGPRGLRAAERSATAAFYHALAPSALPVRKRLPWVCSILDTIPLDLSDYRNLGVKTRVAHHHATRRSDLVLALSEFTRERVEALFPAARGRCRVVTLPVVDVFREVPCRGVTPALASLPDRPYVVALADHRSPDPRKRNHWTDQLAPVLAEQGIGTVVCGRSGPLAAAPDAITWVENPSDTELAAILGRAVGMFYPSAYEGQGLPPLEALAAGCPVVAFRNSAIAEMIGDGEFLLDDPSPWDQAPLDTALERTTLDAAVERFVAWGGLTAPERERLRDRSRAAVAGLTPLAMQRSLSVAYEELA